MGLGGAGGRGTKTDPQGKRFSGTQLAAAGSILPLAVYAAPSLYRPPPLGHPSQASIALMARLQQPASAALSPSFPVAADQFRFRHSLSQMEMGVQGVLLESKRVCSEPHVSPTHPLSRASLGGSVDDPRLRGAVCVCVFSQTWRQGHRSTVAMRDVTSFLSPWEQGW